MEFLSFLPIRYQDLLFSILHLFVIALNVFGWISPKTRPYQRALLLLTAVSWLGLGGFYGWGYCFLTDWHWDVKRQMGEVGLPGSYIHYLLRDWLPITPFWTDVLTGGIFVLLLAVTVFQIVREKRGRGRKAKGPHEQAHSGQE